jgi:hypothetical protein
MQPMQLSGLPMWKYFIHKKRFMPKTPAGQTSAHFKHFVQRDDSVAINLVLNSSCFISMYDYTQRRTTPNTKEEQRRTETAITKQVKAILSSAVPLCQHPPMSAAKIQQIF